MKVSNDHRQHRYGKVEGCGDCVIGDIILVLVMIRVAGTVERIMISILVSGTQLVTTCNSLSGFTILEVPLRHIFF